MDGAFQGIEPVVSLGLNAEGVANDLFGTPVKDDGEVQPAPGGDLDLGHIDAPDVIWLVRARFWSRRSASGAQALLWGNEQVLFFHNPMDTVNADNVTLAVFKIGPDPAVAPERVVGFDRHDQGQEFLIALLGGLGSLAPHSS